MKFYINYLSKDGETMSSYEVLERLEQDFWRAAKPWYKIVHEFKSVKNRKVQLEVMEATKRFIKDDLKAAQQLFNTLAIEFYAHLGVNTDSMEEKVRRAPKSVQAALTHFAIWAEKKVGNRDFGEVMSEHANTYMKEQPEACAAFMLSAMHVTHDLPLKNVE